MVIWLIGLSGAGKTTLGNELREYCEGLGLRSFIIDGDMVRNFYDNDLGYSREDRIANIKRIMLAAHVISKSGTIAIVCNISPFEELRQFARKKLQDYVEIYLKRNVAELQQKDTKGMYRKNKGKTDIVGLEVAFDEPRHPDMTIETGKESVEQSLKRIIDFLKRKYPERFN